MNTFDHSLRIRARNAGLVLAAVSVAVALTACRDGDSPAAQATPAADSTGAESTTAGSGASATDSAPGSRTPSRTPASRTGGASATAYWGDFSFTVDDATIAGEDLTVELTYTNLREETATPADYSEVAVLVDGTAADSYDVESPEIPGLADTRARITAEVPAGTALDDIQLVFGADDQNQTTITLGDNPAVDTVGPVESDDTGTLRTEKMTMALSNILVLPSYEPGDRDRVHVTIDANIQIPESVQPYCLIDANSISIEGPSGTSATTDFSATAYGGDNIDGILDFVTDGPGTGDYTLTVKDTGNYSCGAATFEFTVG